MKITQLKRFEAGASPIAPVQGTAAQDEPVTEDAVRHRSSRRRLQWAAGAFATFVSLATVAWLAHAWSNSSHTVAADRLRIAAVDRKSVV